MKKMNYRRLALSSLLFLPALLQIIFGLTKHLYNPLIDFSVYHQYSRLLLSGQNPYDLTSTYNVPFNYPPSSFLLFVPFSLISLIPAQVLFTFTSIALFTLTSYQFLKLFKLPKYLILILLALLFQNFPVKFTLILGQSNLIVLSLIFLSYLALIKKKDLKSGVFWGLAAAIKMSPLVLIIYFLFTRRLKSLYSGLVTFVLANLAVIALFPSTIDYFLERLPVLSRLPAGNTTLYDHSLRAFLFRLGIPSPELVQTVISALLTIFISLWYLRRKKQGNNPYLSLKFFSLLLITATISSSFAWQHHFVFTFPGFIVASVQTYKKRSLPCFLILLLSALLVGYHFPDLAHPPTANPFLISHTLIGSLLLSILLLL